VNKFITTGVAAASADRAANKVFIRKFLLLLFSSYRLPSMAMAQFLLLGHKVPVFANSYMVTIRLNYYQEITKDYYIFVLHKFCRYNKQRRIIYKHVSMFFIRFPKIKQFVFIGVFQERFCQT